MKKKGMVLRTAAMILAVVLALCPLSVCFAADGAVLETLVGEEIVNLLWESLKAWGIEILEDGWNEINDNVRQWLTGQLYEYLQEELQETFDAWITGMQFYRDTFGRLIGNSEYVEAADEFADHLREAFGITNNATILLTGTFHIGDLQLYKFPVYAWAYDHRNNHDYDGNVLVKISTGDYPTTFAVPAITSNGYDTWLAIDTVPHTLYYQVVTMDGNETWLLNGTSVLQQIAALQGSDWYRAVLTDVWYNQPDSYLEIDSAVLATTDVYAILRHNGNVVEEGVKAHTQVINLPSNDPTYQPGYSIIYYSDGTVAYIDIDWPESISVDNLPAIVSTGSIRPLDLNGAFAPLRGFIRTFEDGFGLMTQLVYNLPTPAVAMALAIMSAMIVFGTIKLFKEH